MNLYKTNATKKDKQVHANKHKLYVDLVEATVKVNSEIYYMKEKKKKYEYYLFVVSLLYYINILFYVYHFKIVTKKITKKLHEIEIVIL